MNPASGTKVRVPKWGGLARRRGLRLRSVASAMNGLESSLTRVVGRTARVGRIGNHAILPDGVDSGWNKSSIPEHTEETVTTIAFFNNKGGVGKTTLGYHL